jgi:hypothetical protein
VTPCAVCAVHVEMRSASFLVEPQNQGRRRVSYWPQYHLDGLSVVWLKTTGTVFFGLTSKPVATVFSSLTSNPVARVSRFGPQNRQLRFGDLGLKITATVSWFGPQNQVSDGLSIAPQNRQQGDDVGHMSRSSGLLPVEASQARVSQSSLMIGGCAMTGGARDTIAEVALSPS